MVRYVAPLAAVLSGVLPLLLALSGCKVEKDAVSSENIVSEETVDSVGASSAMTVEAGMTVADSVSMSSSEEIEWELTFDRDSLGRVRHLTGRKRLDVRGNQSRNLQTGSVVASGCAVAEVTKSTSVNRTVAEQKKNTAKAGASPEEFLGVGLLLAVALFLTYYWIKDLLKIWKKRL